MLVWDRGTSKPDSDAAAGLADGSLGFILQGEKLRGAWRLVRMKPRQGERQPSWLLIKGKDGAARPRSTPDVLIELPLSVISGRGIEEVAAEG